jgi:hypothetical protein
LKCSIHLSKELEELGMRLFIYKMHGPHKNKSALPLPMKPIYNPKQKRPALRTIEALKR